jgi:hypothetical protein
MLISGASEWLDAIALIGIIENARDAAAAPRKILLTISFIVSSIEKVH